MYRFTIALCVSLCLAVLPASGAAIGVVVASGSFRVDRNLVIGNATLFDGNTLETEASSSDVEISGGVHVRLGADSRGKVFRDRLVLEKGLSELDGGANYWIEARGLRVLAGGPGAAGRVAVSGDRKVQAAALAGTMRVTAADGTVVALLAPGMALEFEPQAVTGAQAPFQMTGCLERRAGRFVLRDPLSGVTEEVRGDRLDGEVGRMIEVTATIMPGVEATEGALEVIRITRMRRVGGECVTPAAPPAPAAAPKVVLPEPAAAPTAPAPSAPAAASQPPRPGMSGGSKAVIAGVIVGGAGAGAVVYLKVLKNNDKGTISR